MASAEFKLSVDAKNTIIELVKDLKENIFTLQTEQGDLVLVEFFFKRMHPDMIMQHLIKLMLPHKNRITSRDIDFFAENQGLFSALENDRREYYKKIIVDTGRLGDDDKDVIWEYFDVLLDLAEQKRKRK